MKDAAPGRGRRGSGNRTKVALDQYAPAVRSVNLPVSALRRRAVRDDKLPELRRVYWNLARAGHRLPAEPQIIVIDGGGHERP